MTAEALLQQALTAAESAKDGKSLRDAVVAAFRVGIFAAIEECEGLATQSPSLRDDLLKLAVRLRRRAKDTTA